MKKNDVAHVMLDVQECLTVFKSLEVFRAEIQAHIQPLADIVEHIIHILQLRTSAFSCNKYFLGQSIWLSLFAFVGVVGSIWRTATAA